MRREYLVLGLLALLLLVSGCGSSSGAEEEPLSHRQFVHRTQAWCHRGYLKQEKAMKKFAKEHGLVFGGGEPWEQEVLNEKVVLEFERKKIAFWKSLTPPKSDEKQVEAIIKSMEKGVEVTEKEPWQLAEQGFRPKKPHEPFEETRALTGEYGPWLCGQA
ncbi:MAG TPA: hypothetical protein VF009_02380 [Solirubrobacterales bacterium]